MKPIAHLFLAAAIVLFCGCGRKPEPPPPKTATPPQSAQSKPVESVVKELDDEVEGGEGEEENTITFSYTPGEENKTDKNNSQTQKKEQEKFTSEPVKTAAPQQDPRSKKKVEKTPTAPQETAAALLASSAQVPEWHPMWRTDGVGGSAITDARLTADNSVLIAAETIIGKDERKSTRIVALSTFDWKTLRILQFDGKLITKIRPLSDCISVAYATEAQKNYKISSEIGMIRLERETPSTESAICGFEVSDLCPDRKGEQLFVKAAPLSPDVQNLHVFTTKDMKRKKSVGTGVAGGVLAVSFDNSQFAVAGVGAVEFYGVDRCDSLRSVKLDPDYTPTAALFAKGEKMFAVMATGQPSYFFKASKSFELCDLTGYAMCLDESGDTLIVERRLNNTLLFFKLPELEKIDEFSPSELKPRTPYPALLVGYLPHLKKHVTLDKGGNLCLYSKENKKWRKELVLSCQK